MILASGIENSTTRFSGRVENYVRYRPRYPEEIISYLKKETGFTPARVVADIGSGTGISTELFLECGNQVYGIEPNKEMREKAEDLLKKYPRFVSLDGTAEKTGLANEQIDLIVAGQAFHWFDRARAKTEFTRIGRLRSYAVLMWNERMVRTGFEKAFEALVLKYAIDYTSVDHRNITDREIGDFFNPHTFQYQPFPNQQVFDLTGLKGRLLSDSYIPNEDHPKYQPMIDELHRLFDRHKKKNQVRFEYLTRLYTGKIR